MSVRYKISKLIQKNDNHICITCGKIGIVFYWLRVTRKTINLVSIVRHSTTLCYESYQNIFDSMFKLRCTTNNCNMDFTTIKDLKNHLDKDHRI